jgi:ribosomal-protein-alanine N-acetyltransferase
MLSIRPASSAEAQDLARIGLLPGKRRSASGARMPTGCVRMPGKAYFDFCTRAWPDILVAEWDGDLAGWGACEKADDFITDLWVLPEFQGRGIGTALLDKIEDRHQKARFPTARLDTHARNAGAIKLYKRLGYP